VGQQPSQISGVWRTSVRTVGKIVSHGRAKDGQDRGHENWAVLFVWENFSRVGGVETFLLHCIRGLPAYGLQPFILDVGARKSTQLAQPEAISDYVINVPELSCAHRNIRNTGLAATLSSLNVKAIVLNDWVYSRIALELPSEIPIIAVCHVDSSDDDYFSTARSLADRLNAIIGVSETICERLKTSLPLGRRSLVRKINYGVDSASARRPWVGDRPLQLVYLGRIQQEQKRILDVVRFVQALNLMGVDCVVTLIGEGPDSNALRDRLSEQSGTVRIKFFGPLLHPEAMQQLASQDIYLLFSEFEGLPISLLEALVRGVVPVVSQIRSGISEILVDSVNARTFPVGRPDLAARIVAELAQNPSQLERLSRAAKQLGDKFTVDKMFANYAELFWATIKRGRRGSFLKESFRIATALRKLKGLMQEPYEFYGRAGDGWMAPYGIIRVLDPKPKSLKLDLEIPGWLPFKFPVSIKAVQNDRQIALLRASAPGYPTLTVPLTQSGIIELSADQWFVPAELGLSPDDRWLCYRVASVSTVNNGQAMIHR
jgi:glycosyltransferase involved in cell wall biosynthesis